MLTSISDFKFTSWSHENNSITQTLMTTVYNDFTLNCHLTIRFPFINLVILLNHTCTNTTLWCLISNSYQCHVKTIMHYSIIISVIMIYIDSQCKVLHAFPFANTPTQLIILLINGLSTSMLITYNCTPNLDIDRPILIQYRLEYISWKKPHFHLRTLALVPQPLYNPMNPICSNSFIAPCGDHSSPDSLSLPPPSNSVLHLPLLSIQW